MTSRSLILSTCTQNKATEYPLVGEGTCPRDYLRNAAAMQELQRCRELVWKMPGSRYLASAPCTRAVDAAARLDAVAAADPRAVPAAARAARERAFRADRLRDELCPPQRLRAARHAARSQRDPAGGSGAPTSATTSRSPSPRRPSAPRPRSRSRATSTARPATAWARGPAPRPRPAPPARAPASCA